MAVGPPRSVPSAPRGAVRPPTKAGPGCQRETGAPASDNEQTVNSRRQFGAPSGAAVLEHAPLSALSAQPLSIGLTLPAAFSLPPLTGLYCQSWQPWQPAGNPLKRHEKQPHLKPYETSIGVHHGFKRWHVLRVRFRAHLPLLLIAFAVAGCGRSVEEIKTEFEEVVAEAQSCTADSDCVLVTPGCPFGCFVPVHKDRQADVSARAEALREEANGGGASCAYGCIAPPDPVCTGGACQLP